MEFTAAATYGGQPSPQPTPTPTASHGPGEPEPMGRTVPRDRDQGIVGNPAALLVGMLAVAILLVTVSVRGGVALELST